MEFLRTWMLGYFGPGRMIASLADKPAPRWGLYAQALRGVLDGVLLYLPLAILGRQPQTPSYLTFLPNDQYYWASALFIPGYLLAQWLLLSAILHVILRLSGYRSDIDQILNITGWAGLVVGTALLAWDWIWIGLGLENVVWLGISHLVFDLWAIVLTVMGFERIMKLSRRIAVMLNLVWMVAGVGLAILFVRAPV